MKKSLSLFTALLLITSLAQAGASKKPGENERGERMRKELNLSDEQLVKMKEIRKSRKELQRAAKKKVKEAREDFHKTVANPKASNDELKAKFDVLQAAQSEHHRTGFQTMLEIRSILNEDQRAKFQEKRKKFRKKFEERRKKFDRDTDEDME